MTDKETSLGLEIRQKLNIIKKKEMPTEQKEQRHTEGQGPEKNGGLERTLKTEVCRKWACCHPVREAVQLGVGVGPKMELMFAAHRGARASTAQIL